MRKIKSLSLSPEDIVRAIESFDYDFSCKLRAKFGDWIGNVQNPRIVIRPEYKIYVELEETIDLDEMFNKPPIRGNERGEV